MKHLSFCPSCGKQTLQFDGKNKMFCSECPFSLYHNTAAAVAVIIKHGEDILFTKRNQNPGLGMLDLPGGFTDPHESAEETCARELQEELGMQVDQSKLKFLTSRPNTYHYKGIDYFTLDLFFEYEILNKVFPGEIDEQEISEIVWIQQSEIDTEDLAFESQKNFFSDYIKKTP